jgi:hypothetical protein
MIVQLMSRPLDPLSQPLILSRCIPALIQSILKRILSMGFDDRGIPDWIQGEIESDSGKMDEDVSDDIGLIGWRSDDSVSSRFEHSSGQD